MGPGSGRGRWVVGVLAAVLLVALPGTATAATPASGGDGTRYVALGDSWAAGTAAGAPEAASGSCRRSARAYPPSTARASDEQAWTSRACASATGGGDGQFTSLSDATRVVTATVGSDATGLGALAAACSSTGTAADCDAAATRFDRALATLPRALDSSLAAIRTRAPRATVTLTGYPLLAEGATCATGPADATRATRLDDAVARLDAVLADRAGPAGVRFVDLRSAFAGHGVCAASPWLTPLTGADPLLAGGPTAAGHLRAITPTLAGLPERPAPTPATDLLGRVLGRSGLPGDLAAPLFGS